MQPKMNKPRRTNNSRLTPDCESAGFISARCLLHVSGVVGGLEGGNMISDQMTDFPRVFSDWDFLISFLPLEGIVITVFLILWTEVYILVLVLLVV